MNGIVQEQLLQVEGLPLFGFVPFFFARFSKGRDGKAPNQKRQKNEFREPISEALAFRRTVSRSEGTLFICFICQCGDPYHMYVGRPLCCLLRHRSHAYVTDERKWSAQQNKRNLQNQARLRRPECTTRTLNSAKTSRP